MTGCIDEFSPCQSAWATQKLTGIPRSCWEEVLSLDCQECLHAFPHPNPSEVTIGGEEGLGEGTGVRAVLHLPSNQYSRSLTFAMLSRDGPLMRAVERRCSTSSSFVVVSAKVAIVDAGLVPGNLHSPKRGRGNVHRECAAAHARLVGAPAPPRVCDQHPAAHARLVGAPAPLRVCNQHPLHTHPLPGC